MTSELLERAFTLALTTRLKQHSGIHIDVRSTAWGLLEGKFGGMTVRGFKWRTPLELTADQLMVDVGELALDYQKLVWQQTVALKNVPQGSVAFTLTSQDLANFMVHPLMVAAAARAVKGHAFIFDRSTASVRLDPATGRGIITYQGTWAGDGQRYAVTMSTPPPAAAAAAARSAAAAAAASRAGGVASVVASSNTLEQLTVSARRVVLAPAARSTTGSFASVTSTDDSPAAAAVAAAAAAAVAATTAAVAGARSGPGFGSTGSSGGRARTMTVAPPAPVATATAGAGVATATAGADVAALSAASAASVDEYGVAYGEADMDPGAEVVAEGLRRFFSGLVINLQGIELRNPVLLVQLPGPNVGAAGGASANAGSPRAGFAAQPPRSGAPAPASAPASEPRPGQGAADSSALVPAVLTITMKVAILQLPPLDMKF
ncbi:hypothetical protein PLESTM_001201800 [Pleodorina starrii]|nr:hypothetical protein PLESTM_001201800 [Pleodorina starrii]